MNTEQISWYRTPISKDVLKGLTARSDIKALLHVVAFVILYGGSIALNLFLYDSRAWVLLVLGCVSHSVVATFLGLTAVHELSHGTPFKTKWLNWLFMTIFAFQSWTNHIHFIYSHRKHHQFTYYRERDKEQASDPIPFTWVDYLSWFTFDFKKFWVFMSTNIRLAFGDTSIDYFGWRPMLDGDDKHYGAIMWWSRIQLVLHVGLLVVFIRYELWILIYLVTFSNFFFTAIEHFTGIIQHVGLPGDVPDWRLNARTVLLGPVLRFLYWNMNYHVEHHMYASVPFYSLSKLRNEIAWDLPEPVRGIVPAIRHLLEIRKLQREDPEYRYQQTLPDPPS